MGRDDDYGYEMAIDMLRRSKPELSEEDIQDYFRRNHIEVFGFEKEEDDETI